jgi:hypothetical protein
MVKGLPKRSVMTSDHTKTDPAGSVFVLKMIPGAGTGTQTLDLLLGKEALYQLSYTRMVARLGLEPRTRGSSGHCSTN